MSSLFIGGSWRDAADGATREIRCPADGTHVTTVAEATADDAHAAIAAARTAFDEGPWPHLSEHERAATLTAVAELLARDKADYARAESLDTGKRFVESEYDIDDVIK